MSMVQIFVCFFLDSVLPRRFRTVRAEPSYRFGTSCTLERSLPCSTHLLISVPLSGIQVYMRQWYRLPNHVSISRTCLLNLLFVVFVFARSFDVGLSPAVRECLEWSFRADGGFLTARAFEAPSFELGVVEVADSFMNQGLDAQDADLEANLIRLYGDSVLVDDDLRGLFDSLDTAELDPIVDPAVCPTRALISEGALTSDKGSNAFLPRDEAFQQALDVGGLNPSLNVDTWALNRLRKFREFVGSNISVDLVDMEPLRASALLCEFFERARKENGELYPPPSLMSLLRAFNRVYCKAQQARVLRSGIDEPAFRMKDSPLFRRVCVACVLAMTRSKDAGLGVKRKKAAVISLQDEQRVLGSEFLAKTNSRGLLRRTAFYYLFRFGIRGGSELRGLKAKDFALGTDDKGLHVQFDERLSKNYRITLERFQTEHFRPPVKCHETDVVCTFELYLRRRPSSMEELFLSPIENPRGEHWYARAVVGAKQLANIVKQSFAQVGIVDEAASSNSISNKSGRATLITRMAESGVPPKVGMLITGHRSEGAYSRYDRSSETRVRAAQSCIEGKASYNEALVLENQNLKVAVIEGKGKENLAEGNNSAKRIKLHDAGPHGRRLSFTDEEREPISEVNAWAANYDWANDDEVYDRGKAAVVNNPVTALFGNLTNCSLNVTFSGAVNFNGQGRP